MKPNARFVDLPSSFWACVRFIGQHAGYTRRGTSEIFVPDYADLIRVMSANGLRSQLLAKDLEHPTELGSTLHEYFRYRAQVLNTFVEPRLMDADRAKDEFHRLRKRLRPTCPIPLNKQSGAKKASAYLTGIVNMLIEAHAGACPCDYNPLCLTTVTRNGLPLRTLSRRVDGAFPSPINPVAIWEIKEYYYTTTFGSRVADGIYETVLDGMELADLFREEGIKVQHCLMVDSHYTWWECGRSYLCRIIDALHMGYVDEVLFGYEVIERLPALVRSWRRQANERQVVSGT